jgi:hypothetical protein
MDRLYYQTLTVGAGNSVNTPISQAWPLEDNQLKKIVITIPDGHCGLTGFRILRAQQQIVPFANNLYLVANDRTITYEFDDQISSTGLVLQGYNADIFPHTFYCEATVTNLPAHGTLPEAAVTAPVDTSTDSLVDEDDLTPDSILDTGPIPVITTPLPPPVATGPTPSKPKPVPIKPPKKPLPKPGHKLGGPVRR